MRKAFLLQSTISNGVIWCLFLSWLSPGVSSIQANPTLLGFHPCSHAEWESGYFKVPFSENCNFTLYGRDFSVDTYVYFTTNPENCTSESYPRYSFKLTLPSWANKTSDVSYLNLNLPDDPDVLGNMVPLYFCFNYDQNTTEGSHQGSMPWLHFRLFNKDLLPVPVEIIFIICLIVLSACFSGLNLGLMSLNLTELKIVISCGSKWEKRCARVIHPIRKHGNYLLCTLLLGNVLVNSALTILLDNLTSGLIAVIGSTIIIVIFGEIIPQAICNRYGLFVGALTLPLTVLFLILTFPISFPISKLLDCILGEELGTNYKREELLELVKQDKKNLEQDEKNIIAGALEFKHKTASDVMTPINKVFMLEIKSILDFKTMMKIAQSGHSRIPVYENDPRNIIGLLFVKDLIFHDADDKIPLNTIVKFYNHQVKSVYFDTTLDKILNEFKTGRTHLAIVIKVNDSGEGDPFHENLGVISLEDIIEEIIQCEIVDESDRFFDNRSYIPVERSSFPDFHVFLDADSTTGKFYSIRTEMDLGSNIRGEINMKLTT
ncbi:Metal transporter CNNM4-like isoform X2 [Oopsacas minuta]|uniref:Metal transporter CNNM4-like isoform X2 n=1 Tax=Oopsacas minuta TaxID=111878 RepID=A0AAV7K2N6_9METZ|nr:Metal transporter CNNM4-like isoform X2 [Oopsacas minuta]